MHVQQAATLTVERLITGKGSLATLMPEFAARLQAQQIPKYRELCFGSCRNFYQLEQIIGQLLEKPIRPNENRVKAILIVALYQVMHMRTPNYACVNESVDIARRLNKPWARGLINAVLHEFIRHSDRIIRANLKADAENIGHQPWFAERVREQYPDHWESILKVNNTLPPLCLRVNLRKIKRETYLQTLSRHNIPAKEALFSPAGIYLLKAVPTNKIPGFRDGLVSVQDEGAQLASYCIAPGKEVGLDACAAPGGKTCHLLEMQPSLDLLAVDANEERMNRLLSNTNRIGAQCRSQIADASDIDSWWDGRRFDFILLDAPCTSSGVIRRKPDIRLLLQPERVEGSAELQLAMLESLWNCLKDDGRLLYSTCSIFREENQNIIDQFTVKRGDVQIEPLSFDPALPHITTESGTQLIPTNSGSDGFFYALLKKVS